MKKILSSKIAVAVILLVTVLFLGFYTYMIARPISFGMKYNNKTVYEGVAFEGSLEFYPDGTMINKNTNFEEAFESHYYYKDGYVFMLSATTDSGREKEIESINENIDAALAIPFYAAKLNAFRQVAVGLDDYVTTYTCDAAVVFAVIGGVFALALTALTVSSFILSKNSKK